MTGLVIDPAVVIPSKLSGRNVILQAGGPPSLDVLIPTFNPVAWWKGNDASGNILDASGNGRDLTPVGYTYQEHAYPNGQSYGKFSASRAVRTGTGLSWGTTGLSIFGIRERREVETSAVYFCIANDDWTITVNNQVSSGDRMRFYAGALTPNIVILDGINVDTSMLIGMTISAAGAVNAYKDGLNIGSASANSPAPVVTSAEYGFGEPNGSRNPGSQCYGVWAHTFITKSVLTPTDVVNLYVSCVAQGFIGV